MCSESRVVIQQAFRFELDPNREQRVLLAKSVGASRYVYNWGLAESKRQYALTGKRPLGELKTRLVALKQSEAPWLYEVSAHIGQSAMKDLNVAFERFFKGLKGEGPKAGYPRFKRKGERDSARLYEVTLEERHLRMHKIGRVRLKETCEERGFEGRVLSATISRRADRWFVSLCVEGERAFVLPRLSRDPLSQRESALQWGVSLPRARQSGATRGSVKRSVSRTRRSISGLARRATTRAEPRPTTQPASTSAG